MHTGGELLSPSTALGQLAAARRSSANSFSPNKKRLHLIATQAERVLRIGG